MSGFSLGTKEIGQVSIFGAGSGSSSGGDSSTGTSNMYEIKYSPTSMFQAGNVDSSKNSLTSYQTYSYDELYNINLTRKLLGGYGTNHYASGSLVQLWKNSTNYLDFGLYGYGCSLKNVKDGVTLSTYYLTNSHDDFVNRINNSDQLYAEMNLHDKYVMIKEICNSTLSTIASCDFSDWDVSNLDEFKIITKMNPYSSPVMCQHYRLNSIIDEASYLSSQFEYGHYNSIATTQHIDKLQFDGQYVTLGGTLTENTDYKKSATVSDNSGYFRLGVQASNALSLVGTVMILKFKITSGSVTFTRGAGSEFIYFRKGCDMAGMIKNGNGSFIPENNVEYTMFMKTTSNVGYTSTYGLRASGTFTIEAWDPILTYEQGQNYCAETCNGTGFTGPIPMQSNSIALVEPTINVGTISRYIPIFTQKVTTDGKIAIFTGSAWKYIS